MPAKLAHDAVAGLAYGRVRLGAGARLAGTVAERRADGRPWGGDSRRPRRPRHPQRRARLPETLGLATLLGLRSAGIKDLRRGTLVEADWSGRDLCRRRAGRPPTSHCTTAPATSSSSRR